MRAIARGLRVVLLGALGFGLAFSGWHLWMDHQALHILFAIESARQNAQKPEGK